MSLAYATENSRRALRAANLPRTGLKYARAEHGHARGVAGRREWDVGLGRAARPTRRGRELIPSACSLRRARFGRKQRSIVMAGFAQGAELRRQFVSKPAHRPARKLAPHGISTHPDRAAGTVTMRRAIFLRTTTQALRYHRGGGHDNIALHGYDCYHVQLMEGSDLSNKLPPVCRQDRP